MIFQFEALDKNGSNVTDYIDAASETAARQKIRSSDMYLIKISKHEVLGDDSAAGKESAIKAAIEKISHSISVRFSSKHVGLFSRQLATLLRAGLPLPTAITDIIDQIDNKHFRNVIADLKEKIEEGTSFSNALERHRTIFSEMYINMVRVGENLGSLDQVIERLADLEQKKNILKSKIQAALWYPSFMLLFAVAVVIFLMVSVIPAIAEMFKDQKKDLPLPTEIVIAASNFLSHFWFLIPLAVLLGVYLFQKYTQTDDGRKKIDDLKLRFPLISNLYKKLIVLKFTQNLGILLTNRVDIIKAFEIVSKIVGNVIIEKKISEAGNMIKEGSTVSFSLNRSNFLPKLVLGMISAGESSDKLDRMLVNIGEVYETELDLTVTSLTSLIEPIIIVIMGIVIGTIVLSVMLPIMEMNLLVQ